MSKGPAQPTAWSAEEIRRVGYRAVDLIAQHLSQYPAGPVFAPVPRVLVDAWSSQPPPITGTSSDVVLDTIEHDVLPYPFGSGHPRFFGWVRSPAAVMGIFADAIASAMNPNVAGGNQSAVHVERQVVRWFHELIGFPTSATGQLVSGGSAAALTALGVARHVAAQRAGVDMRAAGLQHAGTTFTAYQSHEAHGCHRKAWELLGVGSSHLREIETDRELRMIPDALDAALRRDRDAGCTPVAVVASAGTVNTGAIDPLDGIADVCTQHGVWLHVDAAYGGPAILTARYRPALAGIARADSVGIDPHKWMFIPVEAGLVLIKDAAATRDAYSLVPPYLRTDGDPEGVGGPPWFSELGLQQTRGFRALKVWASMTHLGLDGYRAAITHTLERAAELAAMVRRASDLDLWEPPGLGIVCFRHVGHVGDRGLGPDALDAVNRALVTDLQLGGEVFPTSTILRGRTYVRCCLLHPATTTEDIERLVRAVRSAGAERAAAGVVSSLA